MRVLVTACASMLISAASLPLYTEAMFDQKAESKGYMVQQEYTNIIAEVEILPPAEIDFARFIRPTDLHSKQLTSLESKHLSLYYLTKWYPLGCEVTIRHAFRYIQQFGVVPANGIDLMKWLKPEIFTTDGFAEFRLLPADEQLLIVHGGINPSTGRLYETFTDETWHQFGICISKLEGEDAIVEIPVAPDRLEPGEDFRTEPRQGWRIILFGEEPGSVLIDKVIRTMVHEAPVAATGSCGCGAKG